MLHVSKRPSTGRESRCGLPSHALRNPKHRRDLVPYLLPDPQELAADVAHARAAELRVGDDVDEVAERAEGVERARAAGALEEELRAARVAHAVAVEDVDALGRAEVRREAVLDVAEPRVELRAPAQEAHQVRAVEQRPARGARPRRERALVLPRVEVHHPRVVVRVVVRARAARAVLVPVRGRVRDGQLVEGGGEHGRDAEVGREPDRGRGLGEGVVDVRPRERRGGVGVGGGGAHRRAGRARAGGLRGLRGRCGGAHARDGLAAARAAAAAPRAAAGARGAVGAELARVRDGVLQLVPLLERLRPVVLDAAQDEGAERLHRVLGREPEDAHGAQRVVRIKSLQGDGAGGARRAAVRKIGSSDGRHSRADAVKQRGLTRCCTAARGGSPARRRRRSAAGRARRQSAPSGCSPPTRARASRATRASCA